MVCLPRHHGNSRSWLTACPYISIFPVWWSYRHFTDVCVLLYHIIFHVYNMNSSGQLVNTKSWKVIGDDRGISEMDSMTTLTYAESMYGLHGSRSRRAVGELRSSWRGQSFPQRWRVRSLCATHQVCLMGYWTIATHREIAFINQSGFVEIIVVCLEIAKCRLAIWTRFSLLKAPTRDTCVASCVVCKHVHSSSAFQDPSKDQEWLEVFGPPVSPALKTKLGRSWGKPEVAMPCHAKHVLSRHSDHFGCWNLHFRVSDQL